MASEDKRERGRKGSGHAPGQGTAHAAGREHGHRRHKAAGSPVIKFVFVVGTFAGIIWGLVRWLLYTLSFTGILPGFLADPFYRRSFLVTGAGHLAGLLAFILFSILAAFLYKLVLGRLKGPYPGIAYGLLWWAVLLLWLWPAFGMIEPPGSISWRSLITEACVFAAWGLFIGFTIAFEYNDDAAHRPAMRPGTLLKP